MAIYMLDSDILSHILRRSKDREKALLLRLRTVLIEDSIVVLSAVVVTNNERHFGALGIPFENWYR